MTLTNSNPSWAFSGFFQGTYPGVVIEICATAYFCVIIHLELKLRLEQWLAYVHALTRLTTTFATPTWLYVKATCFCGPS